MTDLTGIAFNIERLLKFAIHNGIIEKEDVNYARNTLLGLLYADKPYDGEAAYNHETVEEILSGILDYCVKSAIIPDNTITCRDLMGARLMGALTARPSSIISKFRALFAESPQKATEWFYHLSQAVNYIQTERIKKNRCWLVPTPYGDMEITINLSKPEKDAVEIARVRTAPQTGYPKCQLCAENEGFFGHANHPARQNLRLIPIALDNEEWYFQYSPYAYYNEHCIVLKKEHTPMNVTSRTFSRLYEFLDILPHYFIGSNAGLPVVGGSILNHDHFQGGRHVFPMQKTAEYSKHIHPNWPDVTAALIKWPMPVIRLTASRKKSILQLSAHILETWLCYDDETAGVFSHTGNTPHNAVTIIARFKPDRQYETDIVLRNNRATEEFPLGLFHPHPNLHHIKKENIGLIEVMGLAILPARLVGETDRIAGILTGANPVEATGDLAKHADWISSLIRRWGTNNTQSAAEQIIRDDIGLLFTEVLSDAGVFKDTEAGRRQFARFVQTCGMICEPF